MTPPLQDAGGAALFFTGSEFGRLENFYSQFGLQASQRDFTVSERLSPAGFPPLTGQPVIRFRPHPNSEQTKLLQIGPGLFTANAVPPYKSWAEFAPVIASGVEALLAARIEEERDSPFTSASLRYLDAFDASLTQGEPIAVFIERVLGLSVVLPPALKKHLAEGAREKPMMQLQIPMANGVLTLTVGDGVNQSKPAIIVDTTVTTTVPVAASVQAVMAVLEEAHTIIHDLFFELTAPIAHLMGPQKQENLT